MMADSLACQAPLFRLRYANPFALWLRDLGDSSTEHIEKDTQMQQYSTVTSAAYRASVESRA